MSQKVWAVVILLLAFAACVGTSMAGGMEQHIFEHKDDSAIGWVWAIAAVGGMIAALCGVLLGKWRR